MLWLTLAQPADGVVRAARAAGWRPDAAFYSPAAASAQAYADWVRAARSVRNAEIWLTLLRGSSVAHQLRILDEHGLRYQVFAPVAERVSPRGGWGADETGVATWRWEGWPELPR